MILDPFKKVITAVQIAATVSTAASGAVVAEACVLNLTPPSKIGTGICFLDHMCDQLTSHGQLGVTLRCGVGSGAWFAPGRDYATGVAGRPHDRDIFVACGGALGAALRAVVDEVGAAARTLSTSSRSRADHAPTRGRSQKWVRRRTSSSRSRACRQARAKPAIGGK